MAVGPVDVVIIGFPEQLLGPDRSACWTWWREARCA